MKTLFLATLLFMCGHVRAQEDDKLYLRECRVLNQAEEANRFEVVIDSLSNYAEEVFDFAYPDCKWRVVTLQSNFLSNRQRKIDSEKDTLFVKFEFGAMSSLYLVNYGMIGFRVIRDNTYFIKSINPSIYLMTNPRFNCFDLSICPLMLRDEPSRWVVAFYITNGKVVVTRNWLAI